MGRITASDLNKVSNFEQLVELLRDGLEWPIGEDYGFDDVVFEYEASELGLKKDEVAKIREIHQLRPLATNQPWGIFFISMEDKVIPITVLRRILKALVVKKRAGTQPTDRRTWDKSDLIFAASFGKSGARELAFIHFSDGKATGDLPVMKVLGWNARDTILKHEYVASTLREKLAWPDDQEDAEAWRKAWASAFELRLNETIKTSKDLAVRLADLASDIRARVNQLLIAEDDTGPMRTMLLAFRKNLIHDLDEDGFADMFAQTIAYGMLAARISRPMGIVADNLADMVPPTNPFLKELFGNFLNIGGRDKRRGLDFDELGVRDVVDVLNEANMSAVLRDFGDRNPKEDPVIHFYELFLKEYDPKKRMQRGVFYTPRPVVNFIVRGVDEILRTEFGLPLGLADTSTWAEVAARNDRITLPAHVKPDAPFVQILDPATGTGTFMVEVIDLIHKRMGEYWKGQGKSSAEIKAAWNAYVPAHLLPRLTAFELMMAPYTIAHMKVGLKLSETGYNFGSEERARIFLTNALEPARDLDLEERMRSFALAHEAAQANVAKDKIAITVVVGNPPYSVKSFNMGKWITDLCEPYKENVRKEESQIQSLSNDYIKFLRYAQTRIDRSLSGVVGMITGHGYMLGTQPRDLRNSLYASFEQIRVLNLNGSVRRDGVEGVDEPVFEIMTGVGIGLFSGFAKKAAQQAKYLSVEGSLEYKMDWMLNTTLSMIHSKDTPPIPPNFFFWPMGGLSFEYQQGFDIPDFFGTGNRHADKEVYWSTGFTSQQDELAIAFDEAQFDSRMHDLANSASRTAIAELYRTCKTGQWDYDAAKKFAREGKWKAAIAKVSYRPFDQRYTILDKRVLTILREQVQSQLDSSNLALTVSRAINDLEFAHCLVVERRVDRTSLSSKSSTNAYVFPLWSKIAAGERLRRPNINRNSAQVFGKALDLTYEDGIPRGEQQSFGPDFQRQKTEQLGLLKTPWDGRGDLEKSFGPRDLFDYIYAVLHSPGYRSRYAEFLKSDFPRVPAPATRAAFAALAVLGRQLVALHLLRPEESPILKSPGIRFAGSGEARVERGYPEYENGKVMINANRWFEDVPKETWEFHVGGYQVCEKWLKDRAGKGGKKPHPGLILTDEDILHYRRAVTALTETRRLMAEIDQVIETHGGWPGAFKMESQVDA
ncbi:type ISP restriction/modification enzyme [Roseovarius aquimarinus]|uniref:site-specific DNA-methyltransferase (adenine-specific) n=1 Tax=Roseovarius aquimarinus TaxID=1229156 RepID=A0ABW7IB86_9RHOB